MLDGVFEFRFESGVGDIVGETVGIVLVLELAFRRFPFTLPVVSPHPMAARALASASGNKSLLIDSPIQTNIDGHAIRSFEEDASR